MGNLVPNSFCTIPPVANQNSALRPDATPITTIPTPTKPMTDTAAMAASPSLRRGGLRRSLRSGSGGPPALRDRESRSPDHAASRVARGRRVQPRRPDDGGQVRRRRSPSAGRGQRGGERGRSRHPRSRSSGPPALEGRARSATRSRSSGPPALTTAAGLVPRSTTISSSSSSSTSLACSVARAVCSSRGT